MEVPAAEISTCSTCGTVLEETSSGDLGCMVCLLRVGLSGANHGAEKQLAPADGRFGIYVIERHDDGSLHELGRGAMGVTFRAVDTTLNRTVALKIIRPDIAAGGEARARFMRGARAAATLRHPNVATIYHFGIQEETGQCFYAMELVEGETMEERVRRAGPLDGQTTIIIAQQVTAALAEAEKRGLVHRDLKPSNLMLLAPDEAGFAANDHEYERLRVKVIDFGLAKAVTTQTDPMSLTQGGFVGTPSFASPEQFLNASLDVRSDIYSLGVTLWFALTGNTPFSGRSVEEIRRAQQSGELPIEQLKGARAPSRLISLLESMLAREPAVRPGTRNLGERLRRCHAQAEGLRKPTRIALTTGVILVLAVVAFSIFRSSPDVAKRNPEAQKAYLDGRKAWNTRNHDELKKAIDYFNQAIALDPNYAEAYAGLADTYPLLADNDRLIARSEDYSKAKQAAQKVIELDPKLAEPHAALGLVAMNYDWDWATAEREYKRAIELNPNYPTAHHWYAEYLNIQGRFDESLAEIRRANELDPESQIINTDTGKILFFARRYDEAIEVFRESVKRDPKFLQAHDWLGQIYHEKGLYDEAIAEFKAAGGSGYSPWIISMIGRTLAKSGRKAEAEKALHELQDIRKRRELEPQNFIAVYLGLDDKDEVFALLEKEFEVRSTGLAGLKVNPFYDSLRSDPRFADLMQRVHFAPTPADKSNSVHEAYQMGIFIWNSRKEERFPEAEKYFRRAIALDPNYAQAYVGLANVLQFMAWDPQLRRQAYTEAESAARRAVEINPDLAEAHAALGLIAMNYKWDRSQAEREFRRAIELNPEYATGHHWYAEYLAVEGRFEESLREIERARQLNPTLPTMYHDVGKILFYARRFDESEAQFKTALSLDPDFWGAHFWLAQVYAHQKQFPKAFSELQALQRSTPTTPIPYGIAAYVYSLAGDRAQAAQMLAETLTRLSSKFDNLAAIYAYLGTGDKERALSCLERDYKAHANSVVSLRVEPVYDSLRSDPRFADLMRRVNLGP